MEGCQESWSGLLTLNEWDINPYVKLIKLIFDTKLSVEFLGHPFQ